MKAEVTDAQLQPPCKTNVVALHPLNLIKLFMEFLACSLCYIKDTIW